MQLQFVGCGDAFGSGGRYNTCFHVTGDRRQFPDRLRRVVAAGAEAARHRARRHRPDPDHAFPRRSFRRPAVPAARRAVHPPQPSAGHRRARRDRDAADAGDGSAVRAFLEDKAAIRSLGRRARAGSRSARFGAVTVTPYPVVHGESGGPFLAYRIEAEGRVIAYSADTEWTETLIPLGARRRSVHRRGLLLRQDRQEPSQPEDA